MSEFEVKRDKNKSFKATQETIDKINVIIEKSGKEQGEFFEELVNDLTINRVMDPDNESISPDLRKHFESDVQKLKNATNSILSLPTSQMDNIKVEKDQWQATTEKKLNEKQEEIEKSVAAHEELKQIFEESKQQFTELTKVNQTQEKELDVLTKRTADQEQLIQDRNEKIEDLQDRINKLNENIVSKDEQLKSIEPMKDELAASKQTIQSLQQENERLIEKHEEEMQKQKESLIFTCEKEKHKLETTLKDQFAEEKEALRNQVRKETEQSIREFYLAEIQRREDELKEQINQLQKQVQTNQTSTRAKKPKE